MNRYLEERIVAFIDILGFKNMVEESLNSNEVAENLHNALGTIYRLKAENDNPHNTHSQKNFGVEISTFSDCVVISYPITHKGGLFEIIIDLIHLQLELALNNVLIRGGLSIGYIHHSEKMVYGPAMNKAYKLESEIAKYPRIIIEESNLKYGIYKTKSVQNSVEDEKSYIMSCLTKDKEGNLYLDILRQSQELTDFGDEYFEWLCKIRNIIKSGLEKYSGKKDVYCKYTWLKDYFNEVVTDQTAHYPVPNTDYNNQIEFRDSYQKLKI